MRTKISRLHKTNKSAYDYAYKKCNPTTPSFAPIISKGILLLYSFSPFPASEYACKWCKRNRKRLKKRHEGVKHLSHYR